MENDDLPDGFYWAREIEKPNAGLEPVEVKTGNVWVIGRDAWWPHDDFEFGPRIELVSEYRWSNQRDERMDREER